MALTRKYRRHARTPYFLHRGQYPQFVVHQNIMTRRMTPHDIRQFLFLVDVNHHVAAHRLKQPRPLHFARLEYHVGLSFQQNGHRSMGMPEASDPITASYNTSVRDTAEA